uniref:Uncharacterized protein n=1 Tax=Eucampia antarctica TaxID=49252 RepID=A0A7S2S7A3_9STRA|mmetsp:Transcript_4020/g.3789  ORF Transcript_4020/g.3789 Transcript_4020/m.3789 type:complete len:349 (+) Transcript_4020:109-1155(+)
MIGVDRSYIVMRESNCRIEITGLHEHCSPLIFFSSLENGSNYHNIGNGLKEESFYLNRQYTSKLNSSVCDELPDLTAIATRSPILTDDSNFVSTFTHFFNSSHSNSAIKCEHDQQEETHQYPYETIFDDRCCSLAITTSHHHCPIISDDKSTNPLKVYNSEAYECDISCNVQTVESNLEISLIKDQSDIKIHQDCYTVVQNSSITEESRYLRSIKPNLALQELETAFDNDFSLARDKQALNLNSSIDNEESFSNSTSSSSLDCVINEGKLEEDGISLIASNITNSVSPSQPKQGIDHNMLATWEVLAQRRKSRLLSIKRKRRRKKRMLRMLLLPITILSIFLLYGNFL